MVIKSVRDTHKKCHLCGLVLSYHSQHNKSLPGLLERCAASSSLSASHVLSELCNLSALFTGEHSCEVDSWLWNLRNLSSDDAWGCWCRVSLSALLERLPDSLLFSSVSISSSSNRSSRFSRSTGKKQKGCRVLKAHWMHSRSLKQHVSQVVQVMICCVVSDN